MGFNCYHTTIAIKSPLQILCAYLVSCSSNNRCSKTLSTDLCRTQLPQMSLILFHNSSNPVLKSQIPLPYSKHQL